MFVVPKRKYEEVVSKKDEEIKILKAQLNKKGKELSCCKNELDLEKEKNNSLLEDINLFKEEEIDYVEKVEELENEVKVLKEIDNKKHNKILRLVDDLKDKDYSLGTCQLMLSQERMRNENLFREIQKLLKENSILADMHIQTISEFHSKKIKALERRLRKTKSKRIKKKCSTQIDKIKEVNLTLGIEQ